VGDVGDKSGSKRSKQRVGVTPSVLTVADKALDVGQEATMTEESRRPREGRSGDGKKSVKLWRARKTNQTLKFGSVYHVMNNTCIHLRVRGLNIYMCRRGRIYKEPPEEIQ
jgi:hypothetical protein